MAEISSIQLEKNSIHIKYYVRQIFVSLVPILSTVTTGMTMGYSAVLLPQLRYIHVLSNNSSACINDGSKAGLDDLRIDTTNEESWIAASAALAMVPGCMLSSFLMTGIGRKSCFMVINPILTLGWTIIGFANGITSLIFGRLFCGFGAGLLGATSSVYIAETTFPCLRGLLLVGLSLAVAIGILTSHVLGIFLHWRLTAHLCSLIPVICFLFGLFIPESPNWLLGSDRENSATTSWIFLRGENSQQEFQDLKNSMKKVESEKSFTDVYFSKRFLTPLSVVCIFAFVSQFSGINVVTFYSVKMMSEIAGSENANRATIFLDLTRVAFSVLTCWLTIRCPRRQLAIVSSFATSLTLFTLSMCLLMECGKPWLPIVLLFIYSGTIAIGLVPLPWLLCAELFDTTARSFGSGLSAGFAFLCFFAAVKTGPITLEILLPASTFAVYGAIAFSGSVFLYFQLPETKDMALGKIKNVFARESSKKHNGKNVVEITRF